MPTMEREHIIPSTIPFKKRRVPLNAGGCTRFAQDHWRDYLALFSQVDNQVLLVNPNFQFLPFNLKQGEQNPLGVFATTTLSQKPTDARQNGLVLEIWPDHHTRSALWGRMVFRDNQGQHYRDVDLKGIGNLHPLAISQQGGRYVGNLNNGGGLELPGLVWLGRAVDDYYFSEEFTQLGIRCHRVLAIIKLHQIIADTKVYSIEEAVQKKLLYDGFEPVVEVRAFGTKARIRDLDTNGVSSRLSHPKVLFGDALGLVCQELNQDLSLEEYLRWFARCLGQNIGLMHKNGWAHCSLTPHNISLDCRIVDLDTITPLTPERRKIDLSNTSSSLIYLASQLEYDFGRRNRYPNSVRSLQEIKDHLIKEFNGAYTEVSDPGCQATPQGCNRRYNPNGREKSYAAI